MVLLPVFAPVALPFFLLLRLYSARRFALVSGKVRISDVAVGQKACRRKRLSSNAYSSQSGCRCCFSCLWRSRCRCGTDLLLVILSWIFVVARYVHAGIYMTSNNLLRRFAAFNAGALALLVMWVYFALKILLAT